MNSLPTVYHSHAVHDPSVASPTSSAAQATTTVVPAIADARAAANDDAAAATQDAAFNPLWMIAITMACFFTLAAVVIASG